MLKFLLFRVVTRTIWRIRHIVVSHRGERGSSPFLSVSHLGEIRYWSTSNGVDERNTEIHTKKDITRTLTWEFSTLEIFFAIPRFQLIQVSGAANFPEALNPANSNTEGNTHIPTNLQVTFSHPVKWNQLQNKIKCLPVDGTSVVFCRQINFPCVFSSDRCTGRMIWS